mmetsp:Transcript_47807/g.138209  ORF Transcript_47807/g.138209 Transcript_47807/m.138209 type:complete len:213 (-) Transcript_47807:1171-1809(-)
MSAWETRRRLPKPAGPRQLKRPTYRRSCTSPRTGVAPPSGPRRRPRGCSQAAAVGRRPPGQRSRPRRPSAWRGSTSSTRPGPCPQSPPWPWPPPAFWDWPVCSAALASAEAAPPSTLVVPRRGPSRRSCAAWQTTGPQAPRLLKAVPPDPWRASAGTGRSPASPRWARPARGGGSPRWTSPGARGCPPSSGCPRSSRPGRRRTFADQTEIAR